MYRQENGLKEGYVYNTVAKPTASSTCLVLKHPAFSSWATWSFTGLNGTKAAIFLRASRRRQWAKHSRPWSHYAEEQLFKIHVRPEDKQLTLKSKERPMDLPPEETGKEQDDIPSYPKHTSLRHQRRELPGSCSPGTNRSIATAEVDWLGPTGHRQPEPIL